MPSTAAALDSQAFRNHPVSAAQFPAELVLEIGRYLWYGREASTDSWRGRPLGISKCSRFNQLITRERAVLDVCRPWRHVLLGEFGRFVIADCHAGSPAMEAPFLFPQHTREVWLRFDGALLFGNWVIEWARTALSRGNARMSISRLIIVIVEAPNIATTAIEDGRAKELVGVCQRALLPQMIGLFSQPCVAEVSGVQSKGIGDKFACFFMHFSQLQAPPSLTSIDTSRISHGSMLWLIASNVRTIEYLRIASIYPGELQQLVGEDMGSPVFDRLRELLLTLGLRGSQLPSYTVTKQHFPALQLLFVDLPQGSGAPRRAASLSVSEHSFLADLFFRAPCRLRIVRFPLAVDTIGALLPTLLTEARELTLRQISPEGRRVPSTAESNTLLRNMLSIKHIRSVSLDTCAGHTVLPSRLSAPNLCVLSIPYYQLAAEQIHRLLLETPSLSTLYCQLGESTPDMTHQVSKAGRCLATAWSSWQQARTLAVRVSPAASIASVEHLLLVAAAHPYIRAIYLPTRHGAPLHRRLKSATSTPVGTWNSTG